MKKDLVATISSSMRFYFEEVRRLDIFNCPIFSKIYEPSIEPINFAPMTEEEKKEQYERLMEKHKAKMRKSDYLIVINKDGYIGNAVREEIEYAEEIGLGVLYTYYDPDISYIGSLDWKGNTYYLSLPKYRYMEDGIMKYPDFMLNTNIKKIKLASTPDIPNVNSIQYSKEDILKAMKKECIRELFSTGLMQVEYGNSKDKCDSTRINIIDPKMVIGKVICLGTRHIFIEPKEKFFEVFPDSADANLIAYMRYIGETYKRDDSDIVDVTNIRIITWDIWHNELPEEYLKTIV